MILLALYLLSFLACVVAIGRMQPPSPPKP